LAGVDRKTLANVAATDFPGPALRGVAYHATSHRLSPDLPPSNPEAIEAIERANQFERVRNYEATMVHDLSADSSAYEYFNRF
jgi:hypothetical protein